MFWVLLAVTGMNRCEGTKGGNGESQMCRCGGGEQGEHLCPLIPGTRGTSALPDRSS